MFFALYFLWIAFNARLTVPVVIVGAAVAVLMFGFCCRYMGYSLKSEKKVIIKLFYGIEYIVLLIVETIKANVEVTRFVFSRKTEIQPQLVFFKTRLKHDAARVVLANSITLTPGTITVAEDEGTFCVHCLNHHFGEGIENTAFERRLLRMEADKGDV